MKFSKGLLVALIIFISFIVVELSLEGEQEKTLQDKAGITNQKLSEKYLKLQEEKKVEEENSTPSKKAQPKYNYYAEKILSESQRNVDRSIDILNVVATIMGVLVGLLTLIIILAIAFGFFESQKWRAIRITAKMDAKIIKNLRSKSEQYALKDREKISEVPHSDLEKPPPLLKEKLDEINRRLELFEILRLPLKADDYINRGYDFFYKNKFEKALRNYEEAIKIEPDNFNAWVGKGLALDKLSRFKEELKASEKCIELKPNESFPWSNKGSSLIDLKRYEEALEPIKKSLEIMPLNPHAWSNKGKALFGLKRYDESLEAFQEALKLNFDDADSLYNVACLYSIKKDKDNAVKYLKKAVKLDESLAERAKKDKDFEELWNDDNFKEIVG